MEYTIKFEDKKYKIVEDWVDIIEIDFKFQINDKIVIDRDSFDDYLFVEDNNESDGNIRDIKCSLESELYKRDVISKEGIGAFTFIVTDIEYIHQKEHAYGRLYLSKAK